PRPLARLKAPDACSHPDAVRRTADLSLALSESTGSKLFFELWRKLSFSVNYWESVKSEGLTLDSLRDLVGSPLLVLMFHSISRAHNRKEKEYSLSPKRFFQLLRWLKLLRC